MDYKVAPSGKLKIYSPTIVFYTNTELFRGK